MELSDRFSEAFEKAFEIHRKQPRKQSKGANSADAIPFMGHLLGVTSIVIDDGGSEDEVIAALLHDGPEDSEDKDGAQVLEEIGEQFGEQVRTIVDALSDTVVKPKPKWETRKEQYLDDLRKLPKNTLRPKILRVSLADKIHNTRSILLDRADPKVGESVWNRFSRSKEKSLWYYTSLAEIYEQHLGETPLVLEYRRVVEELST